MSPDQVGGHLTASVPGTLSEPPHRRLQHQVQLVKGEVAGYLKLRQMGGRMPFKVTLNW